MRCLGTYKGSGLLGQDGLIMSDAGYWGKHPTRTKATGIHDGLYDGDGEW